MLSPSVRPTWTQAMMSSPTQITFAKYAELRICTMGPSAPKTETPLPSLSRGFAALKRLAPPPSVMAQVAEHHTAPSMVRLADDFTVRSAMAGATSRFVFKRRMPGLGVGGIGPRNPVSTTPAGTPAPRVGAPAPPTAATGLRIRGPAPLAAATGPRIRGPTPPVATTRGRIRLPASPVASIHLRIRAPASPVASVHPRIPAAGRSLHCRELATHALPRQGP